MFFSKNPLNGAHLAASFFLFSPSLVHRCTWSAKGNFGLFISKQAAAERAMQSAELHLMHRLRVLIIPVCCNITDEAGNGRRKQSFRWAESYLWLLMALSTAAEHITSLQITGGRCQLLYALNHCRAPERYNLWHLSP